MVTEEKAALRKTMNSRRAKLDKERKQRYDIWVCEQLLSRIKKRSASIVHAYLPMGTEIDIRPLLEQLLTDGIKVVCPKTLPRPKLENRVLKSLEELETGVMGTKFPAEREVYEGDIDLIVVPGLAIDKSRYRLGYGGGYYDHFLNQHPEAYKVGVYYPFQLVESVPVEPHDVQLDDVLIGEMKPE